MSPNEEVTRMRASNRRRWISSVRPMKANMPATPPMTIAMHLLEAVRDAEHLEHPDRRQQADEMAEEDDQHADVEQVRAPHQLPPPQQLAGAAPPGVLLAVEAQQAAEQEHGQAEIGIPAEHDMVDEVAHGGLL